MVKVLVLEGQSEHFLNIQGLLQNIATIDYQATHFSCFNSEKIIQLNSDVLIVSSSLNDQSKLDILEKLIALEQSSPIIILSDEFDKELDQNSISHGADDCLPRNELSGLFLSHAIQHAIRRKKTEAKLAHVVTHDRLTGLANRYLLNQHLEHAITLAKRSNMQFAVLYIDLDKFKLVNDSLGHEVGDQILKQAAKKLLNVVRETDIVARLGNDEFAILLENTGPSQNIALVAEKIQQNMQSVYQVNEHELYLSASIGIATFPECGRRPETLLKNAEMTLHKAKECGFNQFQFYTDELNQQTKLKLELEKNLRRALINGEFDIHLQPQISSSTQQLVGAEALLRWNHPTHGTISPITFIPLLEDLGLLPGVESWVINQVCKLAKRMTDKYGQMRFSVNISGSHFKAGNLKENIYLALQSSSLDANNLEVELTENIMIEHVEHNSHLLSELKDIGISVALDDFGKGYSSLSYLKNFPADILKIDKAFIDHLVSDQRDSAIVESLIDLSHKLGIRVVAEGVEDKNQLSHLTSMGCDFIQGYYFAKPMPTHEFEQFVNKHNKLFNSKQA